MLVLALPGLAQESKPAQPPRSSLEGTVVNAQGGEPLKKAIVQAIGAANNQGSPVVYSAVTDPDGHFKIEPMDLGRYRVFIEKSGFVDVDQRHHRPEGVEITLLPGKPVDNFILRATPAAAITGRVLDEDGDPMPNVSVSVLRTGYSGCKAQLDTQASERSNDVGEYRVGGLPPGKYLVSASPLPGFTTLSDRKQGDSSPKPELSYVTTYYPSVTTAGEAAPLELHPGETMPVDFSLARVQTFRVRGTVERVAAVLQASGGAGEVVTLQSKGADATIRQGEIDRDGNFDVEQVPPGSYIAAAATPDGDVASAIQPVEVTNSDVNNVRLAAVVHTRVRGQLRVEGARIADLTGFRVSLRQLDQALYIHGIDPDRGSVKRDGTFEIPDVSPGTYEVLVADSSGSPGFFVKQVRTNRRDFTESGLLVSGGTMDVEVIASSASAQIEGSVLDAHDQPASNITVVAIPRPSRRGMLDHYATALSDQFGRFQLSGLRPDDYTVLAWEEVESGAWCDPDFLTSYENAGQKIHVTEGARQSTMLRLTPSADSPK